MITSFSLAPWSEVPPPLCATGEVVPLANCECEPRQRSKVLSYKVARGGAVKVTSYGRFKSVFCPNTSTRSWGGNHPTAADVQIRPFVYNGDVIIKTIGGRVGRLLTLNLTTLNDDNNVNSLNITLEIVA